MIVVGVHGNGGGSIRFARILEHMPPDVRLEAPTLPGFGGVPRDPALTTLAAYAARLWGYVAEVPRPRVVLGHGIGGSIALEMLRGHALDIDGVILHAPVGARLDTRWYPRVMRTRAMRALAQRLLAAPALRSFWARRFFREAPPTDYVERFFEDYRRCEAFSQMFDLITARWFDSLEPRTTPAVLLWGGKERVLDAGQAEAFRRVLPGARVEIVPEWDHFPMIDAPREYARTIASLARTLVPAAVEGRR